MNINAKDLVKILLFPYSIYLVGYSLDSLYNWYDALWWPNVFMHFLGGVSIAFSGWAILDVFKKNNWITTKNKFIDSLIVIIFVMAVAVLWELYEFLSDRYLGTDSQVSVADTMRDQFMGMLGAMVFAFFWSIFLRMRKNN